MVAEVAQSEVLTRAVSARPYRPSWLDALFDAIRALPGPTWLAYLVLLPPGILLSSSIVWLSGLRPVGDFEPTEVFWGCVTIALLAATHYLRNVAGSAFDAFGPALGSGLADPERARYELTRMPAPAVLLITGFNLVITPLYYLADPVASDVAGLSGLGLVARFLSEALTGTVVLAIAYQGLRQMRRVSRLHELAERVDPFSPAPLYAFSRLTARTAAVLLAFNAVGFAATPALFTSGGAALLLGLAWIVGISIAAAAIFALPLLGMHRRLEAMRNDFEAAAGERLRGLLRELNEAIDHRDAAAIESRDRAISALRHEREILKALPTWPWSTGTLRGVLSALALPIVLFLIQRVLTEVLG